VDVELPVARKANKKHSNTFSNRLHKKKVKPDIMSTILQSKHKLFHNKQLEFFKVETATAAALSPFSTMKPSFLRPQQTP
jgi:hypothetical protein